MTDSRSPAERRLMNKAVHYLGRYTASQQRLREVLVRFAERKLDAHDADDVAVARERVIGECVCGLVMSMMPPLPCRRHAARGVPGARASPSDGHLASMLWMMR